MPGLGRAEAGKRAPLYSARRVHTPHPKRWQDGDPCQRRARPVHRRKILSSRRRAGLSSSGAKLSKTFVPFTADVRAGQRLEEEGGRHNPESSIGAPQRRRAAHVTEVEQTEWEDGGREEKPMTISSVCHSQGSPCAPHTPLGPKA